ncbi:TPA: hypothetical protein QFT03_002804 [Kluyvera ascorbata]|nr:hypothetical protein [Kluyvera ascorbata]
MKTPINMLESIAADIVENTSLLEVIYRNNELPPEVDNAIACLIRSMQKTNETAYEYVDQLSKNIAGKSNDSNIDIIDDVLNAITSAKKTEELTRIYIESYFTDKDNDNPLCFMADAIHDYAHKACSELKAIESKFN